ncbi:MAG: serine protease [Burkholderiaceae bacterium]
MESIWIDRRRALGHLLAMSGLPWLPDARAQAPRAIDRVKAGLVAVGSVQRTRSPPFLFRGTGFAVGNGSLIATNAHVVDGLLDSGAAPESMVVVQPGADGKPAQPRMATRVAVDPEHDLALLKLVGEPIPALELAPDAYLRDGDRLLFTGFPIGTVLGVNPATHQAMIAAVTPIAIAPGNSRELDAKTIRRLSKGPFPIYQLDATAYPGNSGSPLYDAASGAVVGVINMVFVKGTKESALSQPSGISYAIPVRYLRELLAGVS